MDNFCVISEEQNWDRLRINFHLQIPENCLSADKDQ